MARYSITNHDGSVVFERGDDLDALMSAHYAHTLFYPLTYGVDEHIWYVLWDDLPVDIWFIGSEKPKQDVLWGIRIRIVEGRDALDVRDEGE